MTNPFKKTKQDEDIPGQPQPPKNYINVLAYGISIGSQTDSLEKQKEILKQLFEDENIQDYLKTSKKNETANYAG